MNGTGRFECNPTIGRHIELLALLDSEYLVTGQWKSTAVPTALTCTIINFGIHRWYWINTFGTVWCKVY